MCRSNRRFATATKLCAHLPNPNFIWKVSVQHIHYHNGIGHGLVNVKNSILLYVDHSILMPMMTSSNGNIFSVTGSFCVEFSCHRRMPLTKASDTGLCFFSLICAWTNGWVNNQNPGDLRRHRAHYYVTIMQCFSLFEYCMIIYNSLLSAFYHESIFGEGSLFLGTNSTPDKYGRGLNFVVVT